jgi:hypothetical protein
LDGKNRVKKDIDKLWKTFGNLYYQGSPKKGSGFFGNRRKSGASVIIHIGTVNNRCFRWKNLVSGLPEQE